LCLYWLDGKFLIRPASKTGASNGLGYIYARCLQSSGGVLPDYIAAYQRVATERLCGLVSHRNLSVAAAAIRALGNMARFGPLTIPDGDMEIDTPSEKGESSAPNFTKKTLVAKLASMLKSPTPERRLTERIAVALGKDRPMRKLSFLYI